MIALQMRTGEFRKKLLERLRMRLSRELGISLFASQSAPSALSKRLKISELN
jgi:hypothetical protein